MQSAPQDAQQSGDQYGQTDMSCRQSAAARAGYGSSGTPSADAQRRYAANYYACMDGANGAAPPPPPNDDYAYGPPPPNGYAYGPTPPYANGPYPYYPYPYYYPPYYGPGVSFGFGFGGGGFRGGGRR